MLARVCSMFGHALDHHACEAKGVGGLAGRLTAAPKHWIQKPLDQAACMIMAASPQAAVHAERARMPKTKPDANTAAAQAAAGTNSKRFADPRHSAATAMRIAGNTAKGRTWRR
jgi:hypothetical protein